MAISAQIYTDSLPLRDLSTGDPKTGETVWLLPEGGTPPGDLIQLTANPGIAWYYDFPGGIVNGMYDLYTGSPGSQVAVIHSGEQVKVRVIREGIVEAGDTDFVKEW
jgi:hypothetical protein